MRPVENEPRRRSLTRGWESAVDLPARARRPWGADTSGDEQAPLTASWPRFSRLLRVLWVLVVTGLTAALATGQALGWSTWSQQVLAVVLGTALTIGLAVRAGIHVSWLALLAAGVGTGAVVTQWPPLLAGAAVGTAVVAACLAVLGTRPAPSAVAVVREVVIALLVTSSGGIAVTGYSAEIRVERFGYTVLVLALVAMTALVYRLGGGLHGLGRRGLILAVMALVLLVVVLDYTAALTRYGPPELVAQVRSAREWTRTHLGGVPHPVDILVGIPALAWGVSLRSRRRQGWWVCVFGVVATAEFGRRVLDLGLQDPAAALGAAYSVLLGLVLGFGVIRVERVYSGKRGRHRQSDTLTRREPPRLQALH